MADITFTRAARSSDLPQPQSASWTEAPTRKQALLETVSAPQFREVEVAGRPVMLTRLPSGEVVAFAARCPHQGTSLRHASVYEGNLRCPQHNYVYDLQTGENLLPTRDARPEALARLRPGHLVTYPVRERRGWILVGEQPNPRPPPPRASAAERPAVPDTPDELVGPAEYDEESLTALVGQELELVLPTRPRPSHLWKMEMQDAAVEIVSQRYHQDEGEVFYRIRLRPQREGVTRLRFVYGRPWDPQPSAVRPFVIHVTST